MKNLKEKQDIVFNELESLDKKANVSTVSPVSNFEDDSRMCLTFVYFLPDELKEKIKQEILEPLKKADSSQYYYFESLLHVTIQNIRVIADPPDFTKENIEIIKKPFENIKSSGKLMFDLKGLLKMGGSLAIKAYPDQNTQEFILNLRRWLEKIGVSDDKQYINPEVVIGNITICRFYKTPNKDFLKSLENLKAINLGKLVVNKISLITTNAVCHKNKTQVIKTFGIS